VRSETDAARWRWLPPGLRPPVTMNLRQERIFLLVGAAALFAGYDLNVFGLAIPQIQASLHIPENQVAVTVTYFRLAAILAMVVCASADLVGRRRLLLITIFGQAACTLATAFVANYNQFVAIQILTRLFGYSEEMLCYVVIAEEVAASARGWASGTLSAMDYLGAGLATLVFAAINLLPFGWRAIYVIGALPLFVVAYLRRNLPETRRFENGAAQKRVPGPRETLRLLGRLAREYPARLGAIFAAVAAFGFATAPPVVLTSKYLQTALHFTPGEVTALFIPGGLIGLGLSILTGRLSDRIGRKTVAIAMVALAGASFFTLYSGVTGWVVAPLWVLGFFGFFSADALMAGFALEIVPTDYRATVSGLRYFVELGFGAVSLWLEGYLYDHFGAHGPAMQACLAIIPLAMLALLFLPEPAGKTLEEMAG
jgi:putative MFS transporter